MREAATVAARQYLWMEALGASVSITIGMIAGFGEGPLWAALQQFEPWGGIPQNLWWGFSLLIVGALLIVVAFVELHYGRHWSCLGMMVAADLRTGLNSALTVLNISMAAELIYNGYHSLWGIVLVNITLGLFLGKATFVDRRLSLALDKSKNTPGLDRVIRDGL